VKDSYFPGLDDAAGLPRRPSLVKPCTSSESWSGLQVCFILVRLSHLPREATALRRPVTAAFQGPYALMSSVWPTSITTPGMVVAGLMRGLADRPRRSG